MAQAPRNKRPDSAATARVDKWLWIARFYKTRSLANQAIESGHVRVNQVRSKPAREIAPGDLVQINRDGIPTEVRVLAIGHTRGSASVAQTLYCETEASAETRTAALALRKLMRTQTAPGERPTKRDRRQIDQMRSTPE